MFRSYFLLMVIRLLPVTVLLVVGSPSVSGNQQSYELPTVKNRICPAEFWKMSETNNNVFCFSTVTIPNIRSALEHNACKKLHPHAKLASFHSDSEINATSTLAAGIIGFSYEFGELVWYDGTPVNYTHWATGHPSINDSSAVVERGSDGMFRTVHLNDTMKRIAFCKLEAEPMAKCSESAGPPDCETGWILRKTYHHVSCYRNQTFDRSTIPVVYSQVVNDPCVNSFKGAHLVSIHNKDEDDFIKKKFAGGLKRSIDGGDQAIGLYIPQSNENLTIHKDLFEWTDGSPVDFDGWDDSYYYCKDGCPAKPGRISCTNNHEVVRQAFNSHNNELRGWHNIWAPEYPSAPAICKKSFKNCYVPSS